MTEYEERSLKISQEILDKLNDIEKNVGYIRRNIEDSEALNFKQNKQLIESLQDLSQIIQRNFRHL